MKSFPKNLVVVLSLLSFGLLVFSKALAQTTSPSPSPAPAPVALKAGYLLDIRTGKVTSDVYITVENHRIKGIGATPPQGIQIIDLSSLLSCPVWLIAMHIFSAIWPISLPDRVSGCRLRKRRFGVCATSRSGCLKVLLHCVMRARMILVTGNSLCATPSTRAGSMVHACNPQEISFRSMAAMEIPRASLHRSGIAAPSNIADTVDDVARAVRRDIKYGADWIKLMGTGGVLDLTSDYKVQELSEEQMAKAVEIAHRAGKRVMVHAEGTEGIKAAVRAASTRSNTAPCSMTKAPR